MEQKYLYSFNVIKNWLGGMGFRSLRSRPVHIRPLSHLEPSERRKIIWRNKADDQYKIAMHFADNPLDLTHYCLIRTREHLYMQNKVEKKLTSGPGVAGKVYSSITDDYYKQSLKDIGNDLEHKLKLLQRIFNIKNTNYDMPVAFATNALYILARNGMLQSNDRVVADKLIPLIHEK